MHLPSLSEIVVGACEYVAVCSILVNVLPKDCVLNGYPRAKKAYQAVVAILAVSAFNLRKFLPAANVKIPFLGFDQYQHDHPELFAESVTDTVVASSTRTTVFAAADDPSASLTPAIKPKE